MAIEKVLVCCQGNSDRSPLFAIFLKAFLKLAGYDAQVESAGIMEKARNGGPASPFSNTSARRLGLDLSKHNKRWVNDIDISKFDLVIPLDNKVVKYLRELGVPEEKLYAVDIEDPYPSKDQSRHDVTAESIISTAFRVIIQKFPPKQPYITT